ncbi:MAG: TonB-dependent receptor [Proteobacteria bacterium]|nr:TonB-dependent receptor [Pseudomonadota bacterium]MBU4296062.1 TonB-dependent receptor [Pseudomonadota bacterium]MCG2747314.1 TonB-dependent receptor [Desulfobulbaceae bacterium]
MKTTIRKTLVVLTIYAGLMMPSTATVLAKSETDDNYFDMGLAQLMQVTITSVAKKPQPLADTAAAVFVITQEDIRRSGVTSIPEALAMAPGIQVARISSSKWSVSSRGFGGLTSNKLLVMIDGRSVYTPAYSGTFWDMQNTLLEDIDRIEVIRGPGGTIWGANAVNGVINIITKKSQDTLGTMVRVGAGNEEKFTTGARYGATIGDSAFGRFYVTANDRDSNELAGSEQDAHDGWRNIQGGFRMDGIVGSKNEWTLLGDLYRNKGDQIVFPFWLEGVIYPATDYGDYTSEGGNLIGSWQHRLSGGDLLTFKAYYDKNDREESYYEQTFTTIDLDLQYETSLGDRNSLTMGTGFRQVDGQFLQTFQVIVPDQTNDLYSAFLQDEIKLIDDRLWLTVGTKYEHNDFTGSEWQPSARLLWKPAMDHSLWTSIARAVRTPSLTEINGAVTVGVYPTGYGTQTIPVRVVGNSDFESETLIAYEAGYRWLVSQHFSFDVAAYYNDYDKIYSNAYIPPSPDLPLVNAKEGDGHGVEIAANWQTNSWLSFYFAYTWQELNIDVKDSWKPLISQEEFDTNNIPKHLLSVRSAIDLTENWQLNCWLRYVSGIGDGNNVDSYYLFDANLIWKPRKDLEIMFAGQNLFNNNQLEYVAEFITPPTEIERSIYGKVTWCF